MIIIIINPGSSTLGCPPNWVQDFESPNATTPEPTQPLPGHLGEDNVLISWWCFLYKYPSQIVSITPVLWAVHDYVMMMTTMMIDDDSFSPQKCITTPMLGILVLAAHVNEN